MQPLTLKNVDAAMLSAAPGDVRNLRARDRDVEGTGRFIPVAYLGNARARGKTHLRVRLHRRLAAEPVDGLTSSPNLKGSGPHHGRTPRNVGLLPARSRCPRPHFR